MLRLYKTKYCGFDMSPPLKGQPILNNDELFFLDDPEYAVEVFCRIGFCFCASSDDFDCVDVLNRECPYVFAKSQKKKLGLRKPPRTKMNHPLNSTVNGIIKRVSTINPLEKNSPSKNNQVKGAKFTSKRQNKITSIDTNLTFNHQEEENTNEWQRKYSLSHMKTNLIAPITPSNIFTEISIHTNEDDIWQNTNIGPINENNDHDDYFNMNIKRYRESIDSCSGPIYDEFSKSERNYVMDIGSSERGDSVRKSSPVNSSLSESQTTGVDLIFPFCQVPPKKKMTTVRSSSKTGNDSDSFDTSISHNEITPQSNDKSDQLLCYGVPKKKKIGRKTEKSSQSSLDLDSVAFKSFNNKIDSIFEILMSQKEHIIGTMSELSDIKHEMASLKQKFNIFVDNCKCYNNNNNKRTVSTTKGSTSLSNVKSKAHHKIDDKSIYDETINEKNHEPLEGVKIQYLSLPRKFVYKENEKFLVGDGKLRSRRTTSVGKISELAGHNVPLKEVNSDIGIDHMELSVTSPIANNAAFWGEAYPSQELYNSENPPFANKVNDNDAIYDTQVVYDNQGETKYLSKSCTLEFSHQDPTVMLIDVPPRMAHSLKDIHRPHLNDSNKSSNQEMMDSREQKSSGKSTFKNVHSNDVNINSTFFGKTKAFDKQLNHVNNLVSCFKPNVTPEIIIHEHSGLQTSTSN